MIIEQDVIKKLPYDGRVLLRCEGGRVTSARTLRDDEHVASLNALIDIAKQSGYSVVSPDGHTL
ncbi:ArsA family ATPase [Serratia sp. RJAL6]|nr:ArsA family ATPase [Enterobacter sp. RJAL6]